MQLYIINPKHQETHTILWLDIVTPYGSFIIQPGHAPMIIDLAPGRPFTFALENGVQKSVTARRAVLTVERTQAKIIMNAPEHG